MKGIESMPIKILATLIIIAVVVGVSVWQINYFLGFNEEAKFKTELTDLFQTTKSLQSFGDTGSFTTVIVNVPAGMHFNISIDGNNLNATLGNRGVFNLTFTGDIVAIRTNEDEPCGEDKSPPLLCLYKTSSDIVNFTSGKYELRLYYGQPADDETKPWTIYFK